MTDKIIAVQAIIYEHALLVGVSGEVVEAAVKDDIAVIEEFVLGTSFDSCGLYVWVGDWRTKTGLWAPMSDGMCRQFCSGVNPI